MKKGKKYNYQNNAYNNAPTLPTFPEVLYYNDKEFTKAYSYKDVQIVGSEYCGNIRLMLGSALYLFQEPNNPADKNAVAVTIFGNGQYYKVGYLARDSRLQRMVNDFYSKGNFVQAFVDNPNDYKMSIAFYKHNKFKQCQNCGFNNPIEGSFCSRCGTKL